MERITGGSALDFAELLQNLGVAAPKVSLEKADDNANLVYQRCGLVVHYVFGNEDVRWSGWVDHMEEQTGRECGGKVIRARISP